MNIRPTPYLRRTPQTTQDSPTSRPLTTAAAATTNPARYAMEQTKIDAWADLYPPHQLNLMGQRPLGSRNPLVKFSNSFLLWCQPGKWLVCVIRPSSASRLGCSHTSFRCSLLSNTSAFAGVIVGVSVSCLIIIALLIYQIKHPKLKPNTLSKNSDPFSHLASSATTGPIKLPPQPALPDHAAVDRDRPRDHTSSNPFSSPRSSRRAVSPAVANSSNTSPRSGPLFTPPGTPTDRNGFGLSQHSEQASLSQPTGRSPFDFFSSGSSGIVSYRGWGTRMSIGAVSSATSQAASVLRPLPIPPHSPPPYSSERASPQQSLSQNNSGAASPLSSAFPIDEKRRSLLASDAVSRTSQPKPFDGEYPIRYTVPSTDDNLGAEGPQSPFRDPNRAALSDTLAVPTRAPRDSMMSSTSTEMEHGNAPPSSWRSHLSPVPPRPTSVVSDPFNNRDFELPNWLDSDPYSRPGQSARVTTSVYSVAQRSVAASSKILPSDTSIRTLTPEPSESNHDATVHVAVLTRFRTTSMGQGTGESVIPGESVEGDGPESFAVQITGGAERRGWGSEDLQQQPQHVSQRMTTGGSKLRPRLLKLDHSSPQASHPALASSGSPTISPGVPLSAEFEARGLGRSFIQSLISKVRWPSTSASSNPRLSTISQGPARGPEGVHTWLREDPFEMPRASLGAASSKLLPSEVGHGDASSKLLPDEIGHGDASSIRSAAAEVGWIDPHPESPNMQNLSQPVSEPVDRPAAVDAPLSSVNQDLGLTVAPDAQESSQLQSQPRTPSPKPVPPPS